jgi:phage gp36-like protein
VAYLTRQQLETRIAASDIADALADDTPGVETAGLWDAIAADASRQVDSRLASRYPVPFASPIPSLVIEAALTFAAEIIYQRRRMVGDDNPWTKPADHLRTTLERIGRGEMALEFARPDGAAPVVAITEAARTYSLTGRLMA